MPNQINPFSPYSTQKDYELHIAAVERIKTRYETKLLAMKVKISQLKHDVKVLELVKKKSKDRLNDRKAQLIRRDCVIQTQSEVIKTQQEKIARLEQND